MGLIIVAGGQYGSEGKGKVASYVANKFDFEAAAMVVHNEKPDIIVMNHLDYIDGVGQNGSLITGTQMDFISMVEKYMDRSVNLLGTNPADLYEKEAVYAEALNF